jgi:hypothetical protein
MWLTLLTSCGAAALLGVGAVVLGVDGRGTLEGGTSPLFPAVARGVERLNGWSVGLLLLAGFIPGAFGKAHPLLVGLATMALFPIMSLADIVVDQTSHNLWPLEWGIYTVLTAPGILGAFLGRRFRRSLSTNRP